ncbi:fructose bisphosphate aldolase [Diaminobutyricibacter tongyongensis]|uniref:fructose-bisphosphate aldolase n=1 Tax=Leifsonia tongyongensis TaxID=1268043 RepID=A0A6L9XYC0_9MICO|nr:fructose bisphosphate aldolase [Diaminobutyricibacter tongyongensis]NEN06439.1 fructose bisphosphate aldolase [Diaminobutyricibacter tongyongensis]
MNTEQLEKVRVGAGFVAALDQSGGSTPQALRRYGIPDDAYSTDAEMFDRVHEMRTRIITSPSFDGGRVIGTILFEDTMNRQIGGRPSADYLWNVKGSVPFLKIDAGLSASADGAQLMKPIPNLPGLLDRAIDNGIFGTKMRSFITLPGRGMQAVVEQQFSVAQQVLAAGLVPIVEIEIDIHSTRKSEAEDLLQESLLVEVDKLDANHRIMLKLTLPDTDNLYRPLVEHPNVLRVLALSGGYSRDEADERLARNNGIIASFSRALLEGLTVQQSSEDFDRMLNETIASIAEASST